jgi:acetoin utilization protein AcuC
VPSAVCVFNDKRLASYNFGEQHPFGPARFDAFNNAFLAQGMDQQVKTCKAVTATSEQIEWFHEHAYVEGVKLASLAGIGYLDQGDTPVVPGIYDAAALVAGTTLQAIKVIMQGKCRRAFNPIGGLHHARRDRAAGFCIFNDCGIAIEALRHDYKVQRIVYVDIDAHHGDGVFYSYETDPELIIADLHEDGHFLYPGTGAVTETGRQKAVGTKLNVPMPMGADDATFDKMWKTVQEFIADAEPEFVLFQCGADSVQGDPITHMAYTSHAHARVTADLCKLADQHCEGRLLALGGGGYNLDNIAAAWCAVVQTMIDNTGDY